MTFLLFDQFYQIFTFFLTTYFLASQAQKINQLFFFSFFFFLLLSATIYPTRIHGDP